MNNPSPAGRSAHGKYGPKNAFDVDQIPLPFACAVPRTLEYCGTKRVWAKAAGSGLDKRRCTLAAAVDSG